METKFFKKVANFLKNLLTNTYFYVIISIVQKDKTKREVFIMSKTKYTKRKDGRYQTSITTDGVKKYLIAKTALM